MILDPLLILTVYLFVFGYIFEGKFRSGEDESRIEYGITVFLGLAIYRVFSEVIGTTAASIRVNVNYVKKIVFPLEILPIIDIIAALYSFFITIALVILGQFFLGEGLNIQALWFPLLVFCFLLLLAGLGWALSSVTVYFLDISHIIPIVTISLLFGSAIFYPVEKIPESIWTYLKFNPILQLIDSSRRVMMWGEIPSPIVIFGVSLFSVIVFYFGFYIFRLLKKGFADVL